MQNAVITTAGNMTDSTYNLLCEGITAKFGETAFKTDTDESIIGGFILQINGYIYDYSIKSKLRQLDKHMSL